MTPVDFEGMHTRLAPPSDWNERLYGPCVWLPVQCRAGVFTSHWMPTWRERWAVLFGAPVRLNVVAEKHPPVSLRVLD